MALHLGRSLWCIFSSLTLYLLFHLLGLCFRLPQMLWWRINGTAALIEASKDPANYTKSAQVFKIRGRYKFDLLHKSSMNDFILTHDEFVHPEYVIARDEIIVFFFTEDMVAFSEAPKGELLWKSEYGSFTGLAQYERAQRLIVMPLASFHRVAEALPDPKAPIAFLACTGRCGSTLLSQVYECTDRVVSYSEPVILVHLGVAYAKKGNCEETRLLTRSMMKHLCRPLHAFPDPVCYAIKPTAPISYIAQLITEVYPEQTVPFYLYRDMIKVSISMYKLSWKFPLIRLIYLLSRISAKYVKQAFELCNLNILENIPVQRFQDDLTCGAYIGAMGTSIYHDLRRKGVAIHGVIFDEFVKSPELGTRAIFKLSRMDESLVKPGLRAMERDSQANSLLSRANLAKCPSLTYTDEDVARASDCLVKLSYPPIRQSLKMDGTIDFETVISQ